MNGNKHENYEILNLIGYGLAKFDNDFIQSFSCSSKTQFYELVVANGIAETTGTVKNRQDLFDPFFDNDRKGWWQKGDAYIHRKIFIDSLYGEMDVVDFSTIVKLYMNHEIAEIEDNRSIRPIIKSKFKQLQETGKEAEIYFSGNYKSVKGFENGKLEDARLLGDGYDFQIEIGEKIYLAEIKGIRDQNGAFRLTEKEYNKAEKYCHTYCLVIVSNLINRPKMTTIFNPLQQIELNKKVSKIEQISYHSRTIAW